MLTWDTRPVQEPKRTTTAMGRLIAGMSHGPTRYGPSIATPYLKLLQGVSTQVSTWEACSVVPLDAGHFSDAVCGALPSQHSTLLKVTPPRSSFSQTRAQV